MLKIITLFFLLPFSMVSQSITGKIYDNESTAKGIQILNITQNIKTFSDENGDFAIKASINDSLKFTSLFHHQKSLKISKEHFDYKVVVELTKKVNELGEVLLNSAEKPKAFDPIDYTQQVSFNLKEDMKRNPHLYSSSSAYGLDLIRLINLFRKKKPKATSIETISFKTFDSLFSKDRFFNKSLLKNDLQISERLNPLFFDYCDAQNLNSKLLEKQNQIILLDSLMHFSKDFKTLMDSSKKE